MIVSPHLILAPEERKCSSFRYFGCAKLEASKSTPINMGQGEDVLRKVTIQALPTACTPYKNLHLPPVGKNHHFQPNSSALEADLLWVHHADGSHGTRSLSELLSHTLHPKEPCKPLDRQRIRGTALTRAGTGWGEPRYRNNTGTQTKERKPLIWANQRK